MSIASRRALLFAPLALAAGGGAAFYAMLQGMRSGEYNPRGVPSALIGRRARLLRRIGQHVRRVGQGERMQGQHQRGEQRGGANPGARLLQPARVHAA